MLMSDWKQVMSRSEYLEATHHSRIAQKRGEFKAEKRYTKLIKRDILYRNRAEEQYQANLGHWYLSNF